MSTGQKKNAKIVPYRRKHRFHFVTTVFVLVLVYLIVQVFRTSTSETIRIFTVQAAIDADFSETCRGIITREEETAVTEQNGWIRYYLQEGKKVGVNAPVYLMDPNGTLSELFEQPSADTLLTDSVSKQLKGILQSAAQIGITGNFHDAADERAELDAVIADAGNLSVMNQLLANEELSGSYKTVSSTRSGYILFGTDSLEGLTPEDITAEHFDEEALTVESHPGGSFRNRGDFAYRLVPDDCFSVTFRISPEDALKYREKKYLTVELVTAGVTLNGSFSMHEASDGVQLATVSFTRYGSEYLRDRFIDIRIRENTEKAFQLPVSSVTTKSFYTIPKEYLMRGGDNGSSYGVLRESGNAEGEFLKVSIYAQTKESYYIVCRGLNQGDYLIPENSRNRYLVSTTAPLTGVYNVNRGYCIFRQVEIIDTSSDGSYYLVRTGTDFGINPFDRIVLDAGSVEENQIL